MPVQTSTTLLSTGCQNWTKYLKSDVQQKLHWQKLIMSYFTLPFCVVVSSNVKGYVLAGFFPSSQTGQRPLQLQASVWAQENVEEGIQQGVETAQAIAQTIDKENGTLQSTWLICLQQWHKPVSTYKVVGSKDCKEVDCDNDEDSYNFVPFVVREGRGTSESHTNVGWSVAKG